ncbi:Protein CL16A [Ataeniobius toweri]|uniref:Protein CL16A n=1 Tax=Ataeniobius toweri TaxID=208326 RepID=A0ABU7A803_9TELE|nr:Protein CL16A [Ataeniobius toweri]
MTPVLTKLFLKQLLCLLLSQGEEIFLDMFEDEYRSMTSKPLNVEYLMMDASILLPPTGTPLTGIDFVKRLPCGDVEKTRKVFQHRGVKKAFCFPISNIEVLSLVYA